MCRLRHPGKQRVGEAFPPPLCTPSPPAPGERGPHRDSGSSVHAASRPHLHAIWNHFTDLTLKHLVNKVLPLEEQTSLPSPILQVVPLDCQVFMPGVRASEEMKLLLRARCRADPDSPVRAQLPPPSASPPVQQS